MPTEIQCVQVAMPPISTVQIEGKYDPPINRSILRPNSQIEQRPCGSKLLLSLGNSLEVDTGGGPFNGTDTPFNAPKLQKNLGEAWYQAQGAVSMAVTRDFQL